MDSPLEVIDAFVDGEAVDAGTLKQALSTADGLDYFVDVWKLREAVRRDPDRAAPSHQPALAVPKRREWRWLVAAALAVGIAGGYAAGQIRSGSVSAPLTGMNAPSTSAEAPGREVFPAPAPTRVIQLEFQPDAARSGGN